MVDTNHIRTGAEILLLIGFMISLGVNVSNIDQGYLPYTCEKETIPDMMCYKLSRVNDAGIQRNCYYDRDNPRKYKVCSTGWGKLWNADDFSTLCPISDDCDTCPTIEECQTCEECVKEECTVDECEEVIKYIGGDCGRCSGGGTCNCPPAPECVELTCDEVNVIAYTDSGKWFCDSIGYDAECIKDETLEMPFLT